MTSIARGRRTTFPITTPEQLKLSSEREAATGSFVQKPVIVERVRYKTGWKNSGRELHARKLHLQDSDGMAQPVGRKRVK